MYKEFLKDIRVKSKKIENMPDRAQDVLNYFDINDFSLEIPIVGLLTKLGFEIFQSDLEPTDLLAYIAVDPKFKNIYGSNKIVCVNIKKNVSYKRFAMAHELAHYIFDFDDNKDLYYYNTYFMKKKSRDIKTMADGFARNLLMPEKIFVEMYEEFRILESKADIVNELEKCFIVPSTEVLERLRELKIVKVGNSMEM